MVTKTIYMPTTYVDELGVIIDKKELRNYSYITLNYSSYEEKRDGIKKIYSIRQIKITGQQTELNFG